MVMRVMSVAWDEKVVVGKVKEGTRLNPYSYYIRLLT
jgi:hypothetical protein